MFFIRRSIHLAFIGEYMFIDLNILAK